MALARTGVGGERTGKISSIKISFRDYITMIKEINIKTHKVNREN